MAGNNLILVVGTYPNAGDAASDFKALKDGEDAGDYKVVGAVVMNRAADGKVEVDEHGGREVAAVGTLGAIGGLVVGLFAPPLLLATAFGAGIGAGIGALVKRHEEKKLGVDLEEYMPPGSSAIVAIVDDTWADRVEKALVKATKRINKAIDSEDYEKLEEALKKSSDEVSDAIES